MIPDLGERSRALDPAGSFIVQAPAGSGKTELLIQRFLVLLARVERPEEIAAITFTIKAAAEMRRRIVEALAAARNEPRPARPHKAKTWELARAALERNDALGWELEQTASRLRIQTIDALCVSLTRRMPVLSRFGAQPEIIEDAGALYAEAARNTLAIVEHDDDPNAADVAVLLGHLDNSAAEAEEMLAGMLARRDHWVRLGRWVRLHGDADDRAALETALGHARMAAIRRAHALFPVVSGAKPLPRTEDIAGWTALSNALLTDAGKWRKHPATEGLRDNEALRRALCAVQSLPPERYDDAQWEALGALTRLAHRALGELKLVFAACGKADFIEMGQRALLALGGEGEPTDLMLALDYRIRHILVDEYQDTSYTQKELLEKLASGWTPDDGRTLFLVGDPMQSIYRFREAEVALFLEARHLGIGAVRLEPLELSANFRSHAGIVDWVNEGFAKLMPGKEDLPAGAVPYSRCAAVNDAEDHAVAVHAIFDGDAEAEARKVVELAREAVEGTTAILVRNRDHLGAILPSLKAAGLPFRAIEIEPLGNRPVVQDLLALTRAISHLGDRTAWLALLRAPWTGLTVADLHAIAGDGDRATVWQRMHDLEVAMRLSHDGSARLQRTRDVLAPFLQRRGRAGLRDTVEGSWLALGGPACVESGTDLEDAGIFLDKLSDFEVAGALPSLADFRKAVEKLFALPDLDASERLQVMTIHNAKGLEFDTVIVPGLAGHTGRDDRKLFMWMQTTAGMLMAPINPAGGDEDPIYEFIRTLDKEKADHESARLLYVAATRARRRVHLLGACARDEHGDAKAPAKGSLLAKLWPAVSRHFVPPREAAAPAAASEDARAVDPDLFLRLAAPVAVAPPAAVAWKPPPDPARTRETIEFSWAGETARTVGSVVHRWLQRIADDEMKGWSARRVAQLEPAIADELAARGVALAELEPAAARAVMALTGSLEDERGRWLLGPQRMARNEYRICAVVEGERRHLVIDRTFVDAEGRTWIVDYKTSAHEGAELEHFLAEQQERYRPQLERYAAASAASGEAMLALYFPLLKGWREWSRAAAEPITG